MVERDLSQHTHPEETGNHQSIEEPSSGRGHSPGPNSLSAEGQTLQSGPNPEAVASIELQSLEPASSEKVTHEEQLIGEAALAGVEPLPLPDSEPIALQTVSMDSNAPGIIPSIWEAIPLGFPPS